ncbi:hypothetical protein KDA00_03180 [Candidatus Saccharibacteria bacterium]|nr:hypothetical protein [Candidatus Saccharibacteria bacterium]
MALIDRHLELDFERPMLNYVHEGELPDGINIEHDLELAMISKGYEGTLQYWQGDAKIGSTEGFSRKYFVDKLNAVSDILRAKLGSIDEDAVSGTLEFAEEIFDVYEGKETPHRTSGSFAFTAATRLQRNDGSRFEAVDYRRETVGCFPIFKYLDSSSAQRAMVGMPPFILDYYGKDSNGGGGVMVFSPLFLDLISDAGDLDKALTWAGNVASETAWLAKERADIRLLSLAALLPKHTDYGRMFSYPGIDTTTGHGGTTWLIGKVVERAIDDGRVRPDLEHKIGVLGVGGIGFAAADYILGVNPDAQVTINDFNTARQNEVGELLRAKYGENRILDAHSAEEVLRFGGVTVSAITRPIDLFKETSLRPGDLEGRVYADDSQPAAVAAEQIEALGGTHTGVIAQDDTEFGAVTMTRFNYGGLGPKEMNQAYGCCVEGAALIYGDAIDQRIDQPVNGDMVRTVGEVCEEVGFSAAPLQTLKNGKAVSV